MGIVTENIGLQKLDQGFQARSKRAVIGTQAALSLVTAPGPAAAAPAETWL